MVTENKQQHLRRDAAADWVSNNPTLLAGEIGFEENTGAFKIGDGATAWTSLKYSNVPSVTAMPASPQTGMRVWRTDLGLEYFYDGTRWLTTKIFGLSIHYSSAFSAESNDVLLGLSPVPFEGVYDIYIESVDTTCYKSSTGTWIINTSWITNGSVTTDFSQETFTHTIGVRTNQSTFTPFVLSSTAECINLDADEISSTGTVTPAVIMNYRIVGT